MKTIRMSVIGIGGRGKWWLGELLKMEDVEVTAVCDKHEDRMEAARAMCAERYGHEVFGSVDYRDVLARDDGSEATLITTYWNDHVKIAIAAMKSGRYAAFEVGPRVRGDEEQCREETGGSEESAVHFRRPFEECAAMTCMTSRLYIMRGACLFVKIKIQVCEQRAAADRFASPAAVC